MPIDIQSITDRKFFRNILEQFFFDKTCFINNSWGNAEVKFLASEGEYVQLISPGFEDEPKNCMAFTRNYNNVIFVYLKFCEKKAEDIYVFNPTKFQVIESERKDKRYYLETGIHSKSKLFITNFISQAGIVHSLSSEENKLKRIKRIIENDAQKQFKYIKVQFYNNKSNDPRMNYFINNASPIFIPDIKSPYNEDAAQIDYYLNTIYNSDKYLNKHKELISEITAPVMYNSWIPYGYIQINNNSPLPETIIEQVIDIASFIDELIKKEKIFSVSADKLYISDISRNGLGIIFSDKKYIQYYLKNSYILLDLILSSSSKASVLADVRHLEMMQDKTIKAGFRIREMDDKGRENFEYFISRIDSE